MAIVGYFRQWRIPGENIPVGNEGIKLQKGRFEKMQEIIANIAKDVDHILLIGEWNID